MCQTTGPATLDELKALAECRLQECPRCGGVSTIDCQSTRTVEESIAYEYECSTCDLTFDWWHSIVPDCLSPSRGDGTVEVDFS